MNFVMTDGRGIKGASPGFVKGIWVLGIFSLSLHSGGVSGIAGRAAMWPI